MPKDKKSLRQMMTEDIGNWGWLDYSYKSEKKNNNPSKEEYVKFLDSLDDEDFYSKYRRITQDIELETS